MRKNQADHGNEEFSFWQSYSDLMSALLLIFILVMSCILIQSMSLYDSKIKEQEVTQNQLMEQQVLLEEQNNVVNEQKKVLEEQQVQIDKLIGIKEEIIRNLSSQLEKTDLLVSVDPKTGSVVFDSNILFASDSFELSTEGEDNLKAFIPVYLNALLTGDYKDYIAEIIIEGHTDTKGSYMYNLELSQKRALAVSTYCLEKAPIPDDIKIEDVRRILTANGRSWSNPKYIDEEKTKVDMDSSRRVEFKVRLKDDEMISQMKGILESE